MNRDTITALAKQAGFAIEEGAICTSDPYGEGFITEQVVRLVALVAQHEREECARMCEERASSGEHYLEGYGEAKGCAAAIRNRNAS